MAPITFLEPLMATLRDTSYWLSGSISLISSRSRLAVPDGKKLLLVANVMIRLPSALRATLPSLAPASLAAAFAALSDPTRLLLLNLVANAEGGQACACDLVEPTGRSQPTVSHHLKVLVEAGLLTREQRGKWAWFAPDNERLDALRQALTPR